MTNNGFTNMVIIITLILITVIMIMMIVMIVMIDDYVSVVNSEQFQSKSR